MTNSTRNALAGVCTVAQSFSDLSAWTTLAGKDVALQQTIALARKLSAGTLTLPEQPKSPTQPLKSIFCELRADDTTGTSNLFWPAQQLAMKPEALFPVTQAELGDVKARLKELCTKFDDAAKPILDKWVEAPDNDSLLESLLLAMQRYTVGVPASDAGDTSLYDHARITGALAAVMADMDTGAIQKLESQSNLAQDSTPIALLVGGDLSGIQDFIYTITSRGAAGALRGRSFYLQMLTEAVMRHTLRRLGLPVTNVVYAGGGKFFLLARAGDGAALDEIRRHTSDVLLRHHAGDLYFSIQSVTLRAKDFFDGRLGEHWIALSDKQRRAKQRRFEELGESAWALFDLAGELKSAGGTSDTQCQVCGREHPKASIKTGETARKCPQCQSYETLGDQLRDARFMALDFVSSQKSNRLGSYAEVLQELGLIVRLSANPQTESATTSRMIFSLDDDDDAKVPNAKTATNGTNGRRSIANVIPRIYAADLPALVEAGVELPHEPVGRIKTFDGMAAQARGIKRLGVLRMDVDNAGKLFSVGLGKRATLARIAHLSFVINLFFEGWAAHLAKSINRQDREQHPERGERLYAVYCGGDDVFFVGAWDAILSLVSQIRADLARYANHAGIHASAGVALIGGKYPLFRAAEDAGDAEDHAKALNGKNAITFLNTPMKWDEFERVQERARQFAAWCGRDGVLNRSFLQTLQNLHLENERAMQTSKNKARKPQYTRATWMAAYQLSRLLEGKRVRESDVAKEIAAIRDALQAPDANTKLLALAARWAQYLLREGKSDHRDNADS